MKSTNQTTDFSIITGFLGAGKTTLLRRLLSDQHGKSLAVIVNEFGETGIDGALLLDDAGDRMREMNNGCVCCEVREDLVTAITQLLDSRDAGSIQFEHIVMETSGIARPGPIVETLHNPKLKPLISLDGIITVVDAFHLSAQLDEFSEAQEQIGVADFIILNKTDLVEPEQLQQLQQRIAAMNAQAQIQSASHCDVDIEALFSIANNSIVRLNAGFKRKFTPHQISNNHLLSVNRHKPHLDHISSLSIEIQEPLQKDLLLDWFSFFIMRYSERLLRVKGILNFKDHDQRTIFQGIHSLFEAKLDREWRADETRLTQIVFIGRDLPEDEIKSGIRQCVVPQAPSP
jgi:G3E family GTPase